MVALATDSGLTRLQATNSASHPNSDEYGSAMRHIVLNSLYDRRFFHKSTWLATIAGEVDPTLWNASTALSTPNTS